MAISNEVEIAFNEKVFYAPITEDKSLEMTPEMAVANATITNFPNYVAYTNKEGKYTIGKATRQVYEDYGASPQNLMDLVQLSADAS